jgi:arylesterase / paraoxonase
MLCIAVYLLLTVRLWAVPGVTHYRNIPGPEDMVIDTSLGSPRLLVSSSDRRHGVIPGEIYEVSIESETVRSLERRGEPEDLVFNPHGLDLVREDDGRYLLYVITHWEEEAGKKHAVIRYRVLLDSLEFDRIYKDDLLVSPNDLSALPGGAIYVSNDSSGKGKILETALALKRSTVVYFDGDSWSVVADRLAMANGIAAFPGEVYVAATREHKVYAFTRDASGALNDKRVLAKIKGPDNVTVYRNRLIVAGHRKSIALSRHLSASQDPPPSPTAVFSVGLDTGEVQLLFDDNGEVISAGSVGIINGGTLYIGQIMDPFVIAHPLD